MDLQELVNNALKAQRAETLAKSDQLTLGEMILKIEAIAQNKDAMIKKYKSEPTVVFDFANARPTGIDSWRGSYAELALEYAIEGKEMTITNFLEMLKGVLGKTLTGYKGGEFLMSKHTPVWVDNYGEASSTAVIDIVDNEYSIILITGFREL